MVQTIVEEPLRVFLSQYDPVTFLKGAILPDLSEFLFIDNLKVL